MMQKNTSRCGDMPASRPGAVWRALALGLAGLAFGATTSAQAEAVGDFYRGKNIDLVVGGNAGGGYDIYARALSRHLSSHIPGNPKIIVKNVPGAGSLIATRSLYHQAPKDGTTIGSIFRGAVMEPIFGDAEKAKFDSRQFSYLASASTADGGTCIVRPDAKVQNFKQAFTETLVVGAAGRGTAIGDMPVWINNLLKTKLKIVAGYKGSPDTMIAFERGEIEGICGLQYSNIAVQAPHWITERKANVIVQLGMKGDAQLNKMNVPMIWDFVKDADDRAVLELIFGQLEFGRPFVAPPGVPKDRVAALRKAFDDTFKDKEFLATVDKLKLEFDPRSGEEVQALVEKLFSAEPSIIARAREVVK
ncbi:MAG: tripartite tricarboxylate transporter substrate-binding protein [Microvirga sp.]